MSGKRYVLSSDVECPICGAEPGQDCTEGSSQPPYVRKLPYGQGHTARVKDVPAPPSAGDGGGKATQP